MTKIIEHKKQEQSKPVAFFATAGFSLISFSQFYFEYFPYISGLNENIFMYGSIAGCVCAIYALHRWVTSFRFFNCYIEDETLYCFSPNKEINKSFIIKLSEIKEVTKKNFDGYYEWHIIDIIGESYILSSTFDTPADQFIEKMIEINSAISIQHFKN